MKDFDIKIHNDERPVTIRDLEPGDFYISLTVMRHGSRQPVGYHIRRRTEDPFNSLTLRGTQARAFPSTKVYRVTILNPEDIDGLIFT